MSLERKVAAIEQAQSPRAVLRWISDLEIDTSSNYLVKGLLSVGAMSVVYGDSNTGKPFFAFDLGLHVARGMPWRGRRTRQGIVIYIAGEGSQSVVLRAIAARERQPKTDDPEIPLAIFPATVNLLDRGADLAHLMEQIRAAEADKRRKVALIVVDTLARALHGGDENSGADMGALIANADLIREQTGAHVMFVHHTGKDASKGARGHSSLRAACDTEIEVSGTTGARSAKVTKQRDHVAGETFGFDLEVVTLGLDDDDDEIKTCVVHGAAAPPSIRGEPKGKNQQLMLGAARQWVKEHGNLIPTQTWLGLCKTQKLRKSRWSETREGLVKSGWFVEAVGGLRYVP